jgi:uncharacterized protein
MAALGRVLFILGLVASPLLYATITGAMPDMKITDSSKLLVVAGLLVGFGSIWGNGCTSGHGICGLSRLSFRSLVAVVSFMTTAIITVFITHHLI